MLQNMCKSVITGQCKFGTIVEHQDESSTNTAQAVGNESLIETLANTFFCCNLLEAIGCALVDVLLDRLLSLHLESSANGVKWVADACTEGDGSLSCNESGRSTHETLVILVWVHANNGVECTQLEATVWDDAHQAHTETSIQGEETARASSCLLQAIEQAIESFLATADIRSQPSSCVVQRVHDAQTACCCHTTR